MAKTAVADIIIPTEFEKYAIERTAELSNFGQCGIVEHAPEWAGPGLAEALDALRHIGVRIALDDVGLGQSNFRMILDCRPDVFKIDSYFVKGCHADFYRQAVLESVAMLASRFGSRVVAEGVECREDVDTLARLGITFFQGHFFSPALASPQLADSGLLRKPA